MNENKLFENCDFFRFISNFFFLCRKLMTMMMIIYNEKLAILLLLKIYLR